MDADLHPSPHTRDYIDNEDADYISRISPTMIATIQEVKDRMSHIELFTEAMEAAEDSWRRKESQYLLQVEELQIEKEKMFEENQKLVAFLEETENTMRTAENDWKWKETLLQFEIDGLRQKQKEVEEKHSLVATTLEKDQNNLLHNEWLLHEQEIKKQLLLDKLECLKKNEEIAELQSQLKQKAEEVVLGKLFQEKLLQQIELKNNEIMAEKRLLLDKPESLEKNDEVAELRVKLKQKTEELAVGKQLQEKLLQQIELKDKLSQKLALLSPDKKDPTPSTS